MDLELRWFKIIGKDKDYRLQYRWINDPKNKPTKWKDIKKEFEEANKLIEKRKINE